MSNLTVQNVPDGISKAFIITQAASRFENIAMKFQKLQEECTEDSIQDKELQARFKQYNDAIAAAEKEMEFKLQLLEKQRNFEIQRADEEFEEFLYSLEEEKPQ